MSTVRQAIESQAVIFADAIFKILRAASLDELMQIARPNGESEARPATTVPKAKVSTRAPKAKAGAQARPKTKSGRLPRRSAEDIATTLKGIERLLGKHPEGLRAEQIRDALGLDKRELPRPLAEGLTSGALSKTGERRATVYTLASSGPKKAAKKRARGQKKSAARK